MRDSVNRQLVSVILPTYNRAAMLPAAVRSVLAQTHRPLQLAIIDDGSTDGTAPVIVSLEGENSDASVEFLSLSQPNAGPAGARNLGLENVGGDFLAFLDDDDYWAPEKLELQLREISRTGADACCCLLSRVTSRVVGTIPAKPEMLLDGDCRAGFVDRSFDASIVSIVCSRAAARAAGKFDTSLVVAEDKLWLFRLILTARFCAVRKVLGQINLVPDSLTRSGGLDDLSSNDDSIERALHLMRACHRGDELLQDLWNQRIADDYNQFIKNRLRAGDLKGARAKYRKAIELIGDSAPMRRTRRKIRRASWRSRVRRSPRDPKAT